MKWRRALGCAGLLWAGLLHGGAAQAQTVQTQTLPPPALSGLQRSQPPTDDPSALFWRVQTCAAEAGCRGEVSFDDPAWFAAVLDDFTGDYVNGRGEWPQLLANCRSQPSLDSAPCTATLVRFHIEHDLGRALHRVGCGSDHDWEAVGQLLLHCLALEDGWVARLGGWLLPWYRLNARWACLTGVG